MPRVLNRPPVPEVSSVAAFAAWWDQSGLPSTQNTAFFLMLVAAVIFVAANLGRFSKPKKE